MARSKRIDLSFSLYHVTSRANSQEAVFQDKRDQNKFLEYLYRYSHLFKYRILAWCLAKTHFHLLLESTHVSHLSELIRRLLTAYTVYYNRRHKRHGHLFQGRFKSSIVDKADYLLTLSRYIHLNPLQTKSSQDPFEYQGSSLLYYLRGGEPEILYTREILARFQGDREKYGQYVREGMKDGQKMEMYQQRLVGGEAFSRRIKRRIKEKQWKEPRENTAIREDGEGMKRNEAERILGIVAQYFHLDPDSIKKGYHAHGKIGRARMVLIRLLREELPWTGRAVSQYLGLRKNIQDYLRTIEGREDVRQAYDKIKKVIFHRV